MRLKCPGSSNFRNVGLPSDRPSRTSRVVWKPRHIFNLSDEPLVFKGDKAFRIEGFNVPCDFPGQNGEVAIEKTEMDVAAYSMFFPEVIDQKQVVGCIAELPRR